MPLYMRRPNTPDIVEAEQVGAGAHTYPGQGLRAPRPGDWVVTNHATGETSVLTNEEFSAQYQAAAIPQQLLAQPGPAGGPFPGQPAAPVAEPPVETPGGAMEPFSPAGPTEPMNESLPGRPAPTPEVRPRLEEPGPIESPTGLPEQPGDADKEFHERQAAAPATPATPAEPATPTTPGGPGEAATPATPATPPAESPPPAQGPDDIRGPDMGPPA